MRIVKNGLKWDVDCGDMASVDYTLLITHEERLNQLTAEVEFTHQKLRK